LIQRRLRIPDQSPLACLIAGGFRNYALQTVLAQNNQAGGKIIQGTEMILHRLYRRPSLLLAKSA
jgi:hypothetical protein